MKKMFLFAAMASVAFANCTTDEKVFDGTDESNEIRFTAAQYSAQSRAEEHGTGDSFTQNITIWSWYNGAATEVIPGKVYTPGTGSFEGGLKYYWPTDGTALDFVAVPTNLVNTAYFTAPGRSAEGATALIFVIPDGNNYHGTNLMTTELVNSKTGGTVALLFRHLLSKVNINVLQKPDTGRKSADAIWTVTVNDIKVTGLKCKGQVVINDSWTAKNNGNSRFWDSVDGSETWQVTSGDAQLYAGLSAEAAPTPFTSAENYYMLPQNLEAGIQKITIEYTVETDYLGNETQPNTVVNYTKTFALKEVTAIKAWAMNKQITYNITIDPSETLTPITFTVNEEVWGSGEGSSDVDPIP